MDHDTHPDVRTTRREELERLYREAERDVETMRARLTERRRALGLPPAPRV